MMWNSSLPRHRQRVGTMPWFLMMVVTAYLLCSTLVVAADEIVVGVVDITSTTISNYLSDQTMGVAQAVGSTPSLRSLMSADYTAKNITMTAEDEEMANVFLTEVQDNESISFMEASVPGNLSAGTSLFVVDPINITTASLPSGSSSMLYFFPTLPEEFYVFGYYFAANKIPGSSINVVLRQDETTSMIYNPIFNALRTALSVFRVQGAAYITSMASLSSLLKPSGTTILLNTSAEDVPLIVDFLEAHDDAVVMISFDDLTKHFNDYRTSFGTAYVPAMERLLFTTNLPPWNESTTGSGGPAMAMATTTTTSNKKDISTYMNLFYKDVADTFHSPAGLRAYFTALIMNEVATTAANTTAPAMQQAIYRAHTVKIGNISFGPYSSVCAAPTPDVNACTVNRGTTNLMLWPYASMALGRGVGRGPLTGYVVAPYYTVDGSGNGFYGGGVAAGQGSSSSDNAILWAILAIIGVMLLLLLLLLLLCCCCGDLGVVCCACCRGHKGSELTVLHVAFVGERHRVEVDEGIASYRRDVHRVLEHHRCREVEETRFGFIVVPPTALKAVEMASDLQEQWQPRRREERYISYRIGMHSGPRDPIDPEYRQHHHHHPRKEGVLAYAETVARVAARTANLGGGAEALLTENTQSHLSPMDCRHFGVMHKGRYGYHMDGTETEMEVYELTCCGSSTNASPLAAADDEHEGSRSVLPKEVSELQTYTSSSSASPHSRPVSSDAAGAMRSDEGERQVEMPLHRQDAIHESFPVREYTSEQHAQREQPQDSPRYMFVEPLHSVEEQPHQPYITRDAAPATEYYCRHNNHEEDVEAIRERELPHDDTHVIHHRHEQVAPLHSVEERAHQKRSIEDPHATNKNNTVPPLHLHDTTLHQHEGMSYISPPFADTMIYTARGERCVEPPASVRAAPQHVYLSNNHSAEYYRSSSSPSPSPVYESASRERCIVRTAPPEEPLFYRHEEVEEHAEHREAVREEPAPVMEDVGEARAPSTLTMDGTPHNQYRSLRSSIVSPAAPRHDSSDERFFHPPPPSAEKRRDAREDRVVIEQSSSPRPTPAHGTDANEPHQPSPPTPTRTGIMHIMMENRQSQPRPSASPDLPSQWSSLPREESPTSPQHTAPATTTPPLPAAPTHYRRGGPSFHGSRIVSCFEVPNDGALYRITDTSTGKWAFYNDSTAYRMHVHFSLGKKSRVAPLGHTVMHENPETGLLEGHLYVEPGTTEMLCVGNVVGHKMRYYARPCGERRRSD